MDYGGQKNRIGSKNSCKCMQTNFGGHGLFGFGNFAAFQFWPKFPFGSWTIVHGGQTIESAQNDLCK